MKKETWAYKISIYDEENELGFGHESEIVFKVTYESTRMEEEWLGIERYWWTHELKEIRPILVNPCIPDVHAKDVNSVNFAEFTEEQVKKVAELSERKKDELTEEHLHHGEYSNVPVYWMD